MKARVPFGIAVLGASLTLALLAAAFAASKPSAPAGADRVESFRVNLDADDRDERVLVYNLPTEGVPASHFEVWNRKQGEWKRGQVTLVNQIPSFDPAAGLVKAWVKDLNSDGRIEIAVRDFVTPSVGEVLTILRQSKEDSRRFELLQAVGGDRVTVETRRRKPALLDVFLKSNHSSDGLEHNEVWEWSKRAGEWRCVKDCGGRPG